MRVLTPSTAAEALACAADMEGSARFVAGGTALQLDWTNGLPQPDALIDLSRVAAFHGLEVHDGSLRIGALTTLNALIETPAIATGLPLLHQALKVVAGPAVRNLATIGGNVAGRNGCLLPALLALDADLEVIDAEGGRRIALKDWLAEPARPTELIGAIHLARQTETSRFLHRKTGLRAAFTPCVIGCAARLDMGADRIVHARFAVGGGVVAPARLTDAETLVTGQSPAAIDWSAVHACLLATIAAPDDAFRSGAYRRLVAANAIVHGLSGRLPKRRSGTRVRRPAQGDALADEIELSRETSGDCWHVRGDMAAKVAGRMPFLTDHRAEEMLVGRILRAGVPHARVLSIDTSAAEALPGVVAVVTHRDIKGENTFGIVVQDQPALCHDKVRHRGDPIAAVAAIDAETADRALGLIRVTYEALPVIDSPEAALTDGAALVHDGGNLQRMLTFARGNIAEGFAGAAHVVEDSYVTPRQMHGFLETEGGYAQLEPDGSLLVCAGGQHGSRDRLQLSRILGMPEDRIRVVTSPTGGAFGGKDELSVQPALALLALKSGRPVRLQLSRAESVLAGQKRHPMTIRMRTACDGEGRLLAQEVEVLADAGAYASLGPGVLETALEHAVGPYHVPHVSTVGRLAYTNNGVCGAFRGFGANQMTYAVECQIDRLAALCGLDAVEIRARNLRLPGSPGALGQVVSPSERLVEMLQAAKSSDLWSPPPEADPEGEWIVGTGMALNYQGNGLGSVVPDPAGGRLALTADGHIEGAYGLDEMGQGLVTVIVAAVAAEVGCGRADVSATVGDTSLAPDSGSTTASRGTYVVWAAAKQAAPEFCAAMRAQAGRLLHRDPESLVLAPGGFAERGSNSGDILLSYKALAAALDDTERPSVSVTFDFPKTDYPTANARFIYAYGATLARVAVSRITGAVRVLDLHQHSAAGPVMDVASYLGQLEGGAVQGLGFTLSEDASMQTGTYLTPNFDSYMMPGMADAPGAMRVFALEGLDEDDGLGPRGVGELGIGAVTPAIANAVAAAIGVWPVVTPFPPESLLRGISP